MMFLAVIDAHSVFFVLFALVACAFALGVLFSNNVVRMAFYLVISLGATAGLFFLAGAEFVGAMQLMIYVGGTLVLLIFGVMLTAQKSFISMATRGGEWVVACGVGGALLVLLLAAAFSVDEWNTPRTNRDQLARADVEDTTRIGAALVGFRTDRLDEPVDKRPQVLSGYLLPFEIASVHLLVVLIGAGYLARAKRRAESRSGQR
jgi:NADH:ubiquinone oxidoreductase subunit 6 (subunit J)